MRILIANRMLGTLLGGGESFDLSVARNLAILGHDVTIITAKPLFSRQSLFYSNMNIVYLPCPNLHSLENKVRHVMQRLGAICRYANKYMFERAVFSWLLENNHNMKFDIIQCCSMLWLPKQILKHFNSPVISWLPGPPSRLEMRLIRSVVSTKNIRLFCHGDSVRVLEDKMGISRGVDFDVIEPGVDLKMVEAFACERESIRKELGLSSESIVGVTVARLVSIKNHAFLIEGLKRAVHEHGKSIVWLMVGEGPERCYLERLTLSKKLKDNIRWLGQMKQSEVHRILAASDVFALTSTYESFSIATIEAMAYQLPIIATNVGFLKNLITDSGGGILIRPGDVDGLTKAILSLSFNLEYRHQLGKKGRMYVERFDWSLIIKKLLRIYEQMLNNRSC